jgi:hypothetical protein
LLVLLLLCRQRLLCLCQALVLQAVVLQAIAGKVANSDVAHVVVSRGVQQAVMASL